VKLTFPLVHLPFAVRIDFVVKYEQIYLLHKFYMKSSILLRRSDGVVRLSISPSQGDDPGFKSRSEQ
jgi:hypothetical protein